MVRLVLATDIGTATGRAQRAAILLMFWAGSRGKELIPGQLRNTDVRFKYDPAGRPTWLQVLRFDTKCGAVSGAVHVVECYSQFNEEFGVAEELDAVSAVFEHMKEHNLLPTKEECRAHARWEKQGLAKDKPGRSLFPPSVQAVDASLVTSWLKKLCKQVLPEWTEGVSSRSLRVGMTNTLLEGGAGTVATAQQVGHRSLTGQRAYVRSGFQSPTIGEVQAATAASAAARVRALIGHTSAGSEGTPAGGAASVYGGAGFNASPRFGRTREPQSGTRTRSKSRTMSG